MADDTAPKPSRPIRAKRHLTLVTDTEAQEAKGKGKGEDVRRRVRTAPDAQTGLTVKQSMFCDKVAEGLCLSDAYRAAYDASGMSDKTVHEAACRLFADSKVSARMKQISQEKADQLRMLAASDAASAVEVFRKMMLTADTAARIETISGCRSRSRSILEGLPTSMADASVAALERGRQSPLSRKSGTVRLALCARTISPMGRPIWRAQMQATALPRLPLGMMNDRSEPCSRRQARLVAA